MNESKKRHSFWRTAEIVLILLLIAVLLFIAGSESIRELMDSLLYPRLYREYV